MERQRILKRVFWFLVIGLLAAAVVFFSLVSFFIRPGVIEKIIHEKIETRLGYRPTFDRFVFTFLPFPEIHFYSFQLTDTRQSPPEKILEAPHIRFRPALLPLAIGKVVIAGVYFQRGNVSISLRDEDLNFDKAIVLEDAQVSIKNIKSNRPVNFRIQGKLWGRTDNFRIKGTFQTDFNDPRIENTGIYADASLNKFDLPFFSRWINLDVFEIIKGDSTLLFSLEKTPASSKLVARGNFEVQNFVYEFVKSAISSLPAAYRIGWEMDFDLRNRILTLKDSSVSFPFAETVNIGGKMNYATREFEDLFIKFKKLKMDMVPRHILSFEEILPVRLGLSGESDVEIFVRGFMGMLSLNARVDLTGTTLTYSKLFSKPANIPFIFRADLNGIGAKSLRGDFSFDFEKASAKGSLVGLDLATGEGELTILTNNFTVEGWQKYIPLARDFEMTGGMKLFSSAKGNLRNLEQAEVMNNFSFTDLGLLSAQGVKIEKLNGFVDVGPFEAELKNLSFTVGKSSVLLNGKMLRKPEPKWIVQISSPELVLKDVLRQAEFLSEATERHELMIDWKQVGKSVDILLPGPIPFEQMTLQAGYANHQLVVTQMGCDFYGGRILADGFLNLNKEKPEAEINLALERINLAKMSDAGEKPFLEGNLFGVLNLKGTGPIDEEWVDRLSGEGTFSVTNGEFQKFDVLGALGQLKELSALNSPGTGTTRFYDLRSEFKVAASKFMNRNMLLIADGFNIEAEGDFDFQGKINFRLLTYLLPDLAQKVSGHVGKKERLGPMPFLLVGSTEEPSLRKDPIALQNFLDQLEQQNFSKIVSHIPQSQDKSNLRIEDTEEISRESRLQNPEPLESGFNLLDELLAKRKVSAS